MTFTRRFALVRCVAFGAGLLAAALPGGGAEPAAPAKLPVRTADDLPRHTYALAQAPSAILQNDAAFSTLAVAVQRDLEADLLAYDIQDRTTLESYKTTQLSLAMLGHDYAAATRLIRELRALEEKPSLKLTTGLVSEAWIGTQLAQRPPGKQGPDFETRLAATVGKLPWDVVQNEIKELKSDYEVRSPALLIGLAQEEIDPAAFQRASPGNWSPCATSSSMCCPSRRRSSPRSPARSPRTTR